LGKELVAVSENDVEQRTGEMEVEMDKKILEKKIEAAKKDLDVWEGLSKTRGLMKDDDLQFESSFSCRLVKNLTLPEGYTYCENKEYGKCAFYRCKDRLSYQEWQKHHRSNHSNENNLYVSCNECNNIRNNEVGFMKSAISKLERDLEKDERNERLRKEFKKMLTKQK
jgi:hypothetical protein